MARVKGAGLAELIGQRCTCEFNLPSSEWPIAGYPAWVVLEAVDMPLIKLRSYHGGEPLWVNAAVIKTIRPARL